MIDFSFLKSRVSIVDAAHHLLQLNLQEHESQYRSVCPLCNPQDKRAIVITPERGLFYCFCGKKGGDVIALVAHVKGCSMREAATILDKHFNYKDEPRNKDMAPIVAETKSDDLQPLKHLDTDHDMVKTMMPVDVAKAVGAGYAHKGMMRGHFAFPLRMPDGKLIGYIGVKEAKTPSTWRL